MILDNLKTTSAVEVPKSKAKAMDSPIIDPYTSSQKLAVPKPGENAKYAYKYFASKGVPSHIAKGLVGNLQQESGVRALTYDDGANGAGGGGVAQWSPIRYKGLKTYAQKSGKNPNVLATQFDYMLHELDTTENKAKNRIWATNNVDDATVAIQDYYFRPNKKMANTANRVGTANSLPQYKYGGKRLPKKEVGGSMLTPRGFNSGNALSSGLDKYKTSAALGAMTKAQNTGSATPSGNLLDVGIGTAGMYQGIGAGLGFLGSVIDSTNNGRRPNKGKTIGSAALSGAGAGAAFGTSILPGWGTAIGGVIGAVGGVIGGGSKAKKQQREYDKAQLLANNDFRQEQDARSAYLYRQQNPYQYKFGGTRDDKKPLIVNDPNHSRLRAYKDSSDLYNNYKELSSSLKKSNYKEIVKDDNSIESKLNNFLTSNVKKSDQYTNLVNRVIKYPKLHNTEKVRDNLYKADDLIPWLINKKLGKQLVSTTIKPSGVQTFNKKLKLGEGDVWIGSNGEDREYSDKGKRVVMDRKYTDSKRGFIDRITNSHVDSMYDQRIIANYSNVKPNQEVIYKPITPNKVNTTKPTSRTVNKAIVKNTDKISLPNIEPISKVTISNMPLPSIQMPSIKSSIPKEGKIHTPSMNKGESMEQYRQRLQTFREVNKNSYKFGGRHFIPEFEVEKGEIMRGNFKLSHGKNITSDIYEVGGTTHDKINKDTGTTGTLGAGHGDIYSNSLKLNNGQTPAQAAKKIGLQMAKVESNLNSKNIRTNATAMMNQRILGVQLDSIFAQQEAMKQYKFGGRILYKFDKGGNTDEYTERLKFLMSLKEQATTPQQRANIDTAINQYTRFTPEQKAKVNKTSSNNKPRFESANSTNTATANRKFGNATDWWKTNTTDDSKSSTKTTTQGNKPRFKSINGSTDASAAPVANMQPFKKSTSSPIKYGGGKPWNPFEVPMTIEQRRAQRRAREATKAAVPSNSKPANKITSKAKVSTTTSNSNTSITKPLGTNLPKDFDKEIRADLRFGNLRGDTKMGTTDPVNRIGGLSKTNPVGKIRRNSIDPNWDEINTGLRIGTGYLKNQAAINRMETRVPISLSQQPYYGYSDRSRLARHNVSSMANTVLNNPNSSATQKQQVFAGSANALNDINAQENNIRMQYDDGFANNQFRINANNNAVINQRNAQEIQNRNLQRTESAANFSNMLGNVDTAIAESKKNKLEAQKWNILKNSYKLQYGNGFVNDRAKLDSTQP